MLLKIFPILLGISVVFSAAIAQANPAMPVRRSDPIFKQWEAVRDKFGCSVLTPIAQPEFSRYEMAAAINSCSDRMNELVAGSRDRAFALYDLTMFEPLTTEFAAKISTLRRRVDSLRLADPKMSNTGLRSIVIYHNSSRVTVGYDQFALRGPSGEYIGLDHGSSAHPQKPTPRPIAAWIIPALKELQSRYGLPIGRIQISNPSDLSSSRDEVAALIHTFAEEFYNRGIKLGKVDADDLLNMQREFPEELVTLQERNRELERQKCLAQPCE
jgi:hypothetical protein